MRAGPTSCSCMNTPAASHLDCSTCWWVSDQMLAGVKVPHDQVLEQFLPIGMEAVAFHIACCKLRTAEQANCT